MLHCRRGPGWMPRGRLRPQGTGASGGPAVFVKELLGQIASNDWWEGAAVKNPDMAARLQNSMFLASIVVAFSLSAMFPCEAHLVAFACDYGAHDASHQLDVIWECNMVHRPPGTSRRGPWLRGSPSPQLGEHIGALVERPLLRRPGALLGGSHREEYKQRRRKTRNAVSTSEP